LSFGIWKNIAIFISQKTFSSGYSGKLFIVQMEEDFLVIWQWCRASYFCVKFGLCYLLPVIWGHQLGTVYENRINKISSHTLPLRKMSLCFLLVAHNKVRKYRLNS
jgi:hypothetical protein